VFIVTGASPRDKEYERQARTQLRSFESRVTLTFLAGLARADLERRLATLPERSIVYYVLFYQDASGENVNPIDVLTGLTAIANRPTYSWVDSTIGHGVVGGVLRDQSALVQALADTAARVLRGENADSVPVTSLGTVPQVDWRQLQRWHIQESRMPSGTRVLFREPSSANRGDGSLLTKLWPEFATVATIVAFVFFVRSRRRHAPDQAPGLSRRLLKAQDEERSRIAAELHDDISQQAAVLAMDLEQAIDAPDNHGPLARRRLREALLRAKSLSKSVHDLSYRLHPGHLRLVGLDGALRQLQRDLAQPGIEITVSADDVPRDLPDHISLCLFRVAQEGLHNAIKHSGARNIDVHLKRGDEALMLTVTDDGAGFDVDATAGTGLGLLNMSERVGGVGGTLSVTSRRGAGTRLDVRVPVPIPAPAEPRPT
jgi:signal transduction histidine kinase